MGNTMKKKVASLAFASLAAVAFASPVFADGSGTITCPAGTHAKLTGTVVVINQDGSTTTTYYYTCVPN